MTTLNKCNVSGASYSQQGQDIGREMEIIRVWFNSILRNEVNSAPDSFKGAKEKARSYSTAFIQLAGRVAHFDVQLAKSINGIRARAELGSGGPYAEIGRFKAAIGELSMRWPSATHYAPKKTHDAPRNAQYGDGDPHPAGSYQHDFYDKDAVG